MNTNTARNLNPANGSVDVKAMIEEIARMQAEQAKLKAENEALKASKHKALTCKISAKGALSVYGLGRFPVTLYRSQWERLMAFIPTVGEFITDHESDLKIKE